MVHAYQMGITKSTGYAFIVMDYKISYKVPELEWQLPGYSDAERESFLNNVVLNGLIILAAVTPLASKDPVYAAFEDDVIRRQALAPFDVPPYNNSPVTTSVSDYKLFGVFSMRPESQRDSLIPKKSLNISNKNIS
jgi:hypothetical protein